MSHLGHRNIVSVSLIFSISKSFLVVYLNNKCVQNIGRPYVRVGFYDPANNCSVMLGRFVVYTSTKLYKGYNMMFNYTTPHRR